MPALLRVGICLQFLSFWRLSAKLAIVFCIKAGMSDTSTGVRKHASQLSRDTIQFRECIGTRELACFEYVLLDFEC
jgi:hypothetical protein